VPVEVTDLSARLRGERKNEENRLPAAALDYDRADSVETVRRKRVK